MLYWLRFLLILTVAQTALGQETSPGQELAPAQTLEPVASTYFEGYAESIDEGPSFSRAVGLSLALKHAKVLSPLLRYSLHLKLKLESGPFRGVYSEEYQPENDFKIKEALLHVQPYAPLLLSFGALDQNDFKTPTLINNESFPGVREGLRFDLAGLQVEATAQQAAATSTHVSEHYSQDMDAGVPSFYLERIRFNHANQLLELSAHASHFAFDDLPASVAYRSRFLGNSATGNGSNGSRFLYGFQGSEFGLGMKTALASDVDLDARVSHLENSLAPSGSNQAQFANLSLNLPAWQFAATWMRIERDASPALYNISWLGHNNRQGFGLEIETHYAGFDFGIGAGESRPIDDIPFQDRFVTMQFKIGKSHDFH